MSAPSPAVPPDDPNRIIEATLAEFSRAVAEARLHDDKIGDYLAATVAGIRTHVALRDDVKQTIDGFRVELKQMLTGPPVLLTDKQVADIGRRLMTNCQAWAGNLVKASRLRSWAMLSASGRGFLLVGALASWIAFGAPLDKQCRDERGGRWCGYWVTPPSK